MRLDRAHSPWLASALAVAAAILAGGAWGPPVIAARPTAAKQGPPSQRNCEWRDEHAAPRVQCPRGSSGGAARADYNGDGFTDLAIGAPDESVAGLQAAGIVQVLFGGPNGLWSRTQTVQQGKTLGDSPDRGDLFGEALAGGDFDGDGYADLAIGVPGEDLGSAADAGMVQIVYGSAAGLSARVQTLTQGPALGGVPEADDRFGDALVWGQFGRGLQADLAIGVPFEDLGSAYGAGMVHVLYGTTGGLDTAHVQVLYQADLDPYPTGVREGGFGAVLAAGNLGRSSEDELLVAAPFGSRTACTPTCYAYQAGEYYAVYGSAAGLTTTGSQLYGAIVRAFAVGDFDGDSVRDLAVGEPSESGGHVALHFGSVSGLDRTAALSDPICQFSPSQCANDFGAAVAAGDFDGDGVADLAVGMPGAKDGAGQVELYRGSASGLGLSGYMAQGSQGFNGAPEQRYGFGSSLSAWNWGRGTQADLAIGVPGEDVGSVNDAGLVQVVYGSSTGLTTSGMQTLTEDLFGRPVTAGDEFGFALY